MIALVYLPKDYADKDRLHATLDPWAISQIIAQQPHPLLDAYAAARGIDTFYKKPNYKLFGHQAPAARDDRLLGMAELVIVFQEAGDRAAAKFMTGAGGRKIPFHIVHLSNHGFLL